MGKHRRHGASTHANRNGEEGNKQYFSQIYPENIPCWRAKAFQCGNGANAAVNESCNRVGDASAADDQRRQTHQRHEIGKTLDKIFSALGCPVTGAHLPASVGIFGSCQFHEVLRSTGILTVRKFDTVAIGDQAAGLNEARCPQRIRTHENAGTQNKSIGNAIRLGSDHAPNFKFSRANSYPVAKFHAKPAEQQRIDSHTIHGNR